MFWKLHSAPADIWTKHTDIVEDSLGLEASIFQKKVEGYETNFFKNEIKFSNLNLSTVE